MIPSRSYNCTSLRSFLMKVGTAATGRVSRHITSTPPPPPPPPPLAGSTAVSPPPVEYLLCDFSLLPKHS